jgi:hypothetical protein
MNSNAITKMLRGAIPVTLALVCFFGFDRAFIPSAKAQTDSNSFPLRLDVQGNYARLHWPSQGSERFRIEYGTNLQSIFSWQSLSTNWPATGTETEFIHLNALDAASGFYRVARLPDFTFNWDGTNFTYADSVRTFTGILLKPTGSGPFPAVIISHGAGGTANGYSLQKAREMLAWGLVCLGPTLTHAAGGETNSVNMGNCAENIARATACVEVLAGLSFVDTNRVALFGHSMGAFATIGDAAALGGRIRTPEPSLRAESSLIRLEPTTRPQP